MRSRLATGIFNVIPVARSSERPCRFSIERNWGRLKFFRGENDGFELGRGGCTIEGGVGGRAECRRGVTNVNTVSRCLPGSLKGSALDGKENIERASMLRHE